MTSEFVSTLGMEAVKTVILLSAPVFVAGMAVGLAVSIFQALTQIQEMTLTFVPKIVAVFIALLFFMPWMMRIMLDFTNNIFSNIPTYIR
ncbi:MAG: flagellar biosynthesis protein FliQ [Thermodesulfobacteriota bacterium]